jgi:hypothetical protein
VQEALTKLRQQSTTGAPKTIKDDVVFSLEVALKWMKQFTVSLDKSRTVTHRLQCIEREILEIKTVRKDIKEIKEAAMKPPKSWAAAVSSPPESNDKQAVQQRSKILQKREQERRERAKYEVTLTANDATEEVKWEMSTATEKTITAHCQKAIENADAFKTTSKPTLNGCKKLENNSIRLHCESEDKVKQLQSINWSAAYEGLKVHKRMYGVVIHGVWKSEINFTMDNKAIIEKLQYRNSDLPSIVKVGPLRRRISERMEQADHHSIVVYTNDLAEADKCITYGIYINYRHFNTYRYMPHLQITQCFNCHDYGHKAIHCRRKRKCGKCADEGHDTKECKSKELKCVQCNGKHEAWHHDCPRRMEEREGLDEVKSSSY